MRTIDQSVRRAVSPSRWLVAGRSHVRASAMVVLAFCGVTLGYAVTVSRAVTAKPLTPGTSWQWQLTGPVDETALDGVSSARKMYDVDLFDTSQEVMLRLRAKGITVICHFSAGTAEDWRPDYHRFPTRLRGLAVQGWSGEHWLDIRNTTDLELVMSRRMDLAVIKGCDGVEPDNVDAYMNQTGFSLTAADQLNYNRLLATWAHNRGLSVGLKNDVMQVPELVGYFDWALNEECNRYHECDAYRPFIEQNKAVFGVEYTGELSGFCPAMNVGNYDWLRKDPMLTAQRQACREERWGTPAPTPTPAATPETTRAAPTPHPRLPQRPKAAPAVQPQPHWWQWWYWHI